MEIHVIIKKFSDWFFGPSIEFARYDNKTNIMTIKFSDGKRAHFKGEATVWHGYPYMRRASLEWEERLTDLWVYWKEHGNSYPTAHKKLNK